jgi:hypothetical protein
LLARSVTCLIFIAALGFAQSPVFPRAVITDSQFGNAGDGQNATRAEIIAIESKLHRELINIADFGAKCDGRTDDTAAIQAAFDSLPATDTNPQGLVTRIGAVILTPLSDAGCIISRTLNMSPRVSLQSLGGRAVIRAAPNFAPTASATERFMINIINRNGQGSVPNASFDAVLRNITLIATAPGNEYTSGINCACSIGTDLDNVTVVVHYRGVVWGGSGAYPPAADDVTAERLSLNMTRTPSGPCSQAIVWPASTGSNAATLYNVKITNDDTREGRSFCPDVPAVDIGANVSGVHIDGLNAEDVPYVLRVGDSTNDISIIGIDAFNKLCQTLADSPQVVTISPVNNLWQTGVTIGGIFRNYRDGLRVGPKVVVPGSAGCHESFRHPIDYVNRGQLLQVNGELIVADPHPNNIGSLVSSVLLDGTEPDRSSQVEAARFGAVAKANNWGARAPQTRAIIQANGGSGLTNAMLFDAGGQMTWYEQAGNAGAQFWTTSPGSAESNINKSWEIASCSSADGVATSNCHQYLQFSQAPGAGCTGFHLCFDPRGTENAAFLGNLKVGGTLQFSGANAVGKSAGALGNNCPATNCSTPYTWLKIITGDGSIGYIPVWK